METPEFCVARGGSRERSEGDVEEGACGVANKGNILSCASR